MKGVIIPDLGSNFPSLSFNSGTLEKEDIYRFMKRDAEGVMQRHTFVGSVVKIKCEFALLTKYQYFNLLQVLTKKRI